MPKDLTAPSQQWNTQDQINQSKPINQERNKSLSDYKSQTEAYKNIDSILSDYESQGLDTSTYRKKLEDKAKGLELGFGDKLGVVGRNIGNDYVSSFSKAFGGNLENTYSQKVDEAKQKREEEINPISTIASEVALDPLTYTPLNFASTGTKLVRAGKDFAKGAGLSAGLYTAKEYGDENFKPEDALIAGGFGGALNAGIGSFINRGQKGNLANPDATSGENITNRILFEEAQRRGIPTEKAVENTAPIVDETFQQNTIKNNNSSDNIAKKINDTYFGGKKIIPDAAPVRSDMPVIDNQEANKVNDFFNPVDKNRVQAQGNTDLPTPASQQDPFIYQPKQADTFGWEKDAQRNNEIQQLKEKITPLNDTLKINETNSLMGVKRENPNDISLPPMGTQKQLLPDVLPADRQEMLSVMQFAKDNNAVDEFISKLPPSARIDEVKQAFDRMPISQPKEDNLLPTMTPAEPRQTKSGILYSNGGQNLGGAFAGGAESEFNQKDYTQDGKHDYKDNIVGALVGILGVKGAKKIFPKAFEDKNINGNTAGMFVGAKPNESGAFSDIATKKTMREIDDSKAKFNFPKAITDYKDSDIQDFMSLENFKGTKEEYINLQNKLNANKKYTLSDVMTHPELFNKYPELKKIEISLNNSSGGSFKTAKVNGENLPSEINIGRNSDNPNSVLLHEIQHAIQQKEGWARGGSPEDFVKPKKFGSPAENINKIQEMWDARQIHKMYGDKWESEFKSIFGRELKDYEKSSIFLKEEDLSRIYKEWKNAENPHQAYQNLHGEQQARATQQRINYTPEQRIKEGWTQTLKKNEGSYNEPIIKYDSGIANSIPKSQDIKLNASPTIAGGLAGGVVGANNDLNGDGKTNINDILIGVGLGAGGTKGALLAKNTNIATKANDIIKKLADTETADKIFGHKIYQKTDYMNLREDMINGKNKQAENFALLHEQLKLLPDDIRTKMYNYMSGDKTIPLDTNIKQLADNYTNEINKMGKELVDLGVLEQGQFDKFKDRYLHRRYEKDFSQKFNSLFSKGKTIQGVHERGNEWNGTKTEYEKLLNNGEIGDFFDGKIEATRMQNGQYKFRQDWTEEQRTRWGEVKDIAFSLPETLMRTREMIDHATMLKKIVDNTNYVSDDAIDGYVHLAGKRYGALNGKYVPADVASDIKEFNNALFGTEGSLLSSKGMETFKALSTFWKKSHTVYNPIAHLNNLLSNVTMQFGAGINPNKAVVNATRGALASQKVNQFRELTAKQIIGLSQEENATLRALAQDEDLKLWNEAQQAGLFGRSNLNDILNRYVNPNNTPTSTNKFKNGLQKADEFASSAYQGEDNIMRFSMLKSLTESGTSFDDAIKQVNSTVPDYTKPMSQWARFGRDSMLTPFISWTYYATPIILKQMKERPERIAAIYGALYGMNQMFGIDPFNEKDIPQQNFSMKRIPIYKDGNEVTTIKVDRWIPHNDVLNPLDFVKNLTSGGAWSPIKDIPRNQDSYFGGKITNKEGALKAYHLAKYGVQQITPDVIDNAYNLAESQFMEAKKRSTNAVTKPRTTAQELLKFLGINAMTYDKANQAKKAMRDKED